MKYTKFSVHILVQGKKYPFDFGNLYIFCYPRAIFDIVFCALEYNKENPSLNLTVLIIVFKNSSLVEKNSNENHKMSSQNRQETDKNRQKTDKIVGSAK